MCVIDREMSRLSVLSTSTSENQTLQMLEDADADAMEVDNLPSGNMSSPLSDADVGPSSSSQPISKSAEPISNSNVIHTPDGKIIVETLDTPALRREKSMRRKAERERLRLAAEAHAQGTTSSAAGPSTYMRSESSSLTDLDLGVGGDDNDEQGRRRPQVPDKSIVVVEPKDPAVVVLADGETLEGGTLVWAKAREFYYAITHS